MDYYLLAFKKYADFSGRARRKEYWTFFGFNFAISFALGVVGAITGLAFLGPLYALAVLCPGFAVGVRRLHDTGRSAWWVLIVFIPVIGILVTLYFMLQDSQPGANEYGPNPKEAPASVDAVPA